MVQQTTAINRSAPKQQRRVQKATAINRSAPKQQNRVQKTTAMNRSAAKQTKQGTENHRYQPLRTQTTKEGLENHRHEPLRTQTTKEGTENHRYQPLRTQTKLSSRPERSVVEGPDFLPMQLKASASSDSKSPAIKFQTLTPAEIPILTQRSRNQLPPLLRSNRNDKLLWWPKVQRNNSPLSSSVHPP